MTLEEALRLARTLQSMQFNIEDAANNSAIPVALRQQVRAQLWVEQVLDVRDPTMVENRERPHTVWLPDVDRANWYYWPRLRNYLIDRKGWVEATVRSVERASDRILDAMENPLGDQPFNIRGLVVGYVQSGKTANYTALIAKAVDCGYRLVIVLTGIHKSLRLQTQRRLVAELVGREGAARVGVGLMEPIPPNRAWSTFTRSELDGDFDPGHANAAALGQSIPILLVIKKNASVLRRVTEWLDTAHKETQTQTPCLIIDDEADLASVNTKGNRPPVDGDPDVDDEDDPSAEDAEDVAPSKINEQIRSMLKRFARVAYVAYTATPFANVLINHEAIDREAGEDLYPRSFIVALPQPHGYCGAERIFGTVDGTQDGMDVIRPVPDGDLVHLVPSRASAKYGFQPSLPDSLRDAIDEFILAGAGRAQRGDGHEPATMLIHGSFYTVVQQAVTAMVADAVDRLRDEWRYFRLQELQPRLERRWEEDFRRVTRTEAPDFDVPFDGVAPHIGPFLEQLVVRQLNYGSPDEIDYEKDPNLKVAVIGGNKLSRGLTLEGLLISYFVRKANTYDTLMQMGRWFGFRDGYVDLTRIYTTATLEQWFRDLATVEEELRAEIARYEDERLTPLELGVKIRAHPSMLVTSRLKMKSATEIEVSFAGQLLQTITFPFDDPSWFPHNVEVIRTFLGDLGPATRDERDRPMWVGVPALRVVDFLRAYRMDPNATRVRSDLLLSYIQKQLAQGELTEWIVGVMGLSKPDGDLGTLDLGIDGCPAVGLIDRSRLIRQNSLKAITSSTDQEIGLTAAQRERLETLKMSEPKVPASRLVRRVRDPHQGVLLVYPISRRSGITTQSKERRPIFDHPDEADHVIGVAVAFPESSKVQAVKYLVGTVGNVVD